MKIRVSLRAQLLLSASFLLAIPYMGYQYIWELESYLRVGQEQTMVGTARAVATALHERPELFNNQSAFLQDVEEKKDLYAHTISSPIRLDGKLSDWKKLEALMHEYENENVLFSTRAYERDDIRFRHTVGQFGEYLYVVFEVIDDSVVFRNRNSLDVDKSDFLQIGLSMPSEGFKRFIIAPYESEWVNAFLLDSDNRAISIERKIQGQWLQTEKGYNIELRLPLGYINGEIAFALSDVDDQDSRVIEHSIGTANPNYESALGTVLIPSPQIERIIKGLKHSNSRVWVVDKHKRVLAKSGEIQKVHGFKQEVSQSEIKDVVSINGLMKAFEARVLLPLYYQILTKPSDEFVDELKNAYALKGRDIDSALMGKPNTLWRLSADNKAVILSASHPIFLDEQVMGAVVVEQTTHGIRTLRNQALEKLFNFFLLIILIGIVSFTLISTRISTRIRKLRNETESAIDAHGKIKFQMQASHRHDEIGDLSRSFVSVLERLGQYNSYLENMASRLSHELRTPVAIVSSSLDLLLLDPQSKDTATYVARAKDGITRLSNILTKMSEATRLEQTIHENERERFNLSELLKGCVQGYRIVHQNVDFVLSGLDQSCFLNGNPELFSQMLDKVVTNAVEFKEEHSDIFINLVSSTTDINLFISNKGPLLPENLSSELTDSMVSVRTEKQAATSTQNGQDVHLGLGLYLAKIIAEFHEASLHIQNQSDLSGVVVNIKMARC